MADHSDIDGRLDFVIERNADPGKLSDALARLLIHLTQRERHPKRQTGKEVKPAHE